MEYVHDKVKQIECKLCPKVYKSPNSLSNHIRNDHNMNSALKTTFCKYCSKEIQRSIINKHIKIEHLGIRYKCNPCEKSYKSNSMLQMHVRANHSSIKELKCNLCTKKFSENHRLKLHISVVHKGVKKYQCDSCEKSFGQFGTLSRHKEARHSKERNYKCELCYMAFYVKILLKKHVSEVHEHQRKFKCDPCNKSFGQNTTLVRHRKTKIHIDTLKELQLKTLQK